MVIIDSRRQAILLGLACQRRCKASLKHVERAVAETVEDRFGRCNVPRPRRRGQGKRFEVKIVDNVVNEVAGHSQRSSVATVAVRRNERLIAAHVLRFGFGLGRLAPLCERTHGVNTAPEDARVNEGGEVVSLKFANLVGVLGLVNEPCTELVDLLGGVAFTCCDARPNLLVLAKA